MVSRLIIATHADDIDGIASAALILKKYPNARIVFTRPTEVLRMSLPFDMVVDLPKPRNCKVCIDHHRTNYERLMKQGALSDKDLVDPNSPSAARLVAKYFGLMDSVSQEIVRMADRADTGDLSDDLLALDIFIKHNSRDQEALLWLAKKMALLGRKLLSDREFLERLAEIEPIIRKATEVEGVVRDIAARDIKVAIFNAMRLPYAIARLPASLLANLGGIGLSYYIEPDTGRIKVSIRAGTRGFRADLFAMKYGGGGHESAAGLTLKDESKLPGLIFDFIRRVGERTIAYVRLE